MNWEELKRFCSDRLNCLSESENLDNNLYLERLEFEFKEIGKQGAESYWIKVADSGLKDLKNPNKLLIAYLLGVCNEDPIQTRVTPMLNSVTAAKLTEYKRQYNLYPEDIVKDTDMPDIDIDCLPESRDPLKEYAIKRYGSDVNDAYGSVCSVGTWQTYKLRSAILDASTALELMTRYEAERFTTEMPEEVDELREGGFSVCKSRVIKDGIEEECGYVHDKKICPSCGQTDTESPTIGRLLEDIPQLMELHKKHPELIEYSKQLVGRIRNQGMHAGALIITDRPLFGNVPLAKSGQKGYWVSMWTEGRNTQLSKFGYVKWDLLGLKTLKYLFKASKLIEENRGITFGENFEGMDYNDPDKRILGFYFDDKGVKHFMNLDDVASLKLANEQKTDGIFQFDTDLARKTLENGVRSFEDLMLLSAMGHPGPLQSIPEVIANRDSANAVWKQRMHPAFLEILEPTYGKIVYQEQLTALWQSIANFTGPEAQESRKAIAKKWTHKLKDIEKKWIDGASLKIGVEEAKKSFDEQVSFGRYAFNKSHGVSYTLLAMRSLWLKAHFAPEFWAAIMSDCHSKKLPRYMGVARSEEWKPTEITYCSKKPDKPADGVIFSTIDINNLQKNFSVSGDSVNQGLIGIKGIGENAADLFAGKNDYKTLDEFIEGRKSKTVLERFIKLGAFSKLPGHENSRAVWTYYQYHHCSGNSALKKQVNTDLLALGGWDEITVAKERQRQEFEYRRAYPKRNKMPKAITSWMPNVEPTLANISKITSTDFNLEERLEFQKDYIGYFIDSPMAAYRTSGDGTIAAAKEKSVQGKEAYINAIVQKFEEAITKTGKPFGKLMVHDGATECMIFIWARELAMQDKDTLVSGIGINVAVDYDEVRNLFCVSRGQRLYKLKKR